MQRLPTLQFRILLATYTFLAIRNLSREYCTTQETKRALLTSPPRFETYWPRGTPRYPYLLRTCSATRGRRLRRRNGPFAARVGARASAKHLRSASATYAYDYPDAGCMRSNSMAPLASGTPCCTTVARWCTDGAKAPAEAAKARTALYMVQVCKLLVLCKPLYREHARQSWLVA